MNTAELACLVATLGLIMAAFVWLAKLTWMLAQIEIKVATMWSFQIRRAVSEIAEKGIGTVNSPIVFTADALHRLDSIKDKLVEMEKKHWGPLTDAETLLEIERIFGRDLLEKVCLPANMTHGACLILALSVARGGTPIKLNLEAGIDLTGDGRRAQPAQPVTY